MSNSNTEVSTKNFDVGEGVGVNPGAVGTVEAHREKAENTQGIIRPGRQDKLPNDLALENFSAGNGGGSEFSRNAPVNVPKRTSSAPLEEHEHNKPLYEPQKTHAGLTSSPAQNARKSSGNRSKSNSISDSEPSPVKTVSHEVESRQPVAAPHVVASMSSVASGIPKPAPIVTPGPAGSPLVLDTAAINSSVAGGAATAVASSSSTVSSASVVPQAHETPVHNSGPMNYHHRNNNNNNASSPYNRNPGHHSPAGGGGHGGYHSPSGYRDAYGNYIRHNDRGGGHGGEGGGGYHSSYRGDHGGDRGYRGDGRDSRDNRDMRDSRDSRDYREGGRGDGRDSRDYRDRRGDDRGVAAGGGGHNGPSPSVPVEAQANRDSGAATPQDPSAQAPNSARESGPVPQGPQGPPVNNYREYRNDREPREGGYRGNNYRNDRDNRYGGDRDNRGYRGDRDNRGPPGGHGGIDRRDQNQVGGEESPGRPPTRDERGSDRGGYNSNYRGDRRGGPPSQGPPSQYSSNGPPGAQQQQQQPVPHQSPGHPQQQAATQQGQVPPQGMQYPSPAGRPQWNNNPNAGSAVPGVPGVQVAAGPPASPMHAVPAGVVPAGAGVMPQYDPQQGGVPRDAGAPVAVGAAAAGGYRGGPSGHVPVSHHMQHQQQQHPQQQHSQQQQYQQQQQQQQHQQIMMQQQQQQMHMQHQQQQVYQMHPQQGMYMDPRYPHVVNQNQMHMQQIPQGYQQQYQQIPQQRQQYQQVYPAVMPGGQHYDVAAEQMKAAAASGAPIMYNSAGTPMIMVGQQQAAVQGRGGYVNQYGGYPQQHQMQPQQQVYAQQVMVLPDGRHVYVPVQQPMNMGMGGMVPMQMVAGHPQGMHAGYPQMAVPHGMVPQQQAPTHGVMHHQGQVYIPGQAQPGQPQVQAGHPMAGGHVPYHPQQQQQIPQGPPQHTYRNLHASPSVPPQAGSAPQTASPSPATVSAGSAVPTAAGPPVAASPAPAASPAHTSASPATVAATTPATTAPSGSVGASPATVPVAPVVVSTAAPATPPESAAPVVVAPVAVSAVPASVPPATEGVTASPSVAGTPSDLPPKQPRKVLTYKSKTGETIDIKSFKADTPGQSVGSTPPVSASPVTVPVTDSTDKLDETPGVAEPVESPAVEAAPAAAAASVVAPVEVRRTSIEISEPLQQLRISSPTQEEIVPVNPSPLVKNTSLPVTLAPSLQSGFSISKAKTASSQSTSPDLNASEGAVKEAVSESATTTVSVPPGIVKVPAKNRNDFHGGDMLDAYTTKTETPAVVVASPATPAVPASGASAAPSEPEIADSWEDESAQATLLVDVAPAKRRLVPNGGKFPPQAVRKVIVYTKQEMFNLRPPPEAKNPLPFYDNIVTLAEGASAGGAGERGASMGQGGVASSSGSSNKSGGGPGGWPKKEGGRNSYGGGNAGGVDGTPDWNRDTKLPPAQNQSGKNKKNLGPPPPMPKKQISDPMELLSLEVVAHLNKITPQTFEKLSQSMMSIYVGNTSMLDRLIELIFEKAVQEPNFTVVYADLCSFLSNNAHHWLFFTIVRIHQAQEFFWIKDFNFEANAAGPFYSQKECIAVADSDKLPPMKPLVSGCEPQEVVLCGDVLLKILYNGNTREYWVSYVPFSDVPFENRSQNTFLDEETALKDAKKKNNFRSRLVNICQAEFQSSVATENKTQLEDQLNALRANKANMSESDFQQQEAALEEARQKAKRRMLGNIRFVGELYKQGLLQMVTMHSCIQELLGTPGNWIDIREDQDIELLCRLITTVGETLEQKSRSSKDKSHLAQFNSYFDRMYELSKDKTLNSRMRFAIEEVINLRGNMWQARRQQEGPVKLSEIHQKIEEEARQEALRQQQMYSYRPGGGYNNRGPAPQQMYQSQQQVHQSQGGSSSFRIMKKGDPVMASPASVGKGSRSNTPRAAMTASPSDNSSNNSSARFSRTSSLGPGVAAGGDSRHTSNEGASDMIRRLNSDPSVTGRLGGADSPSGGNKFNAALAAESMVGSSGSPTVAMLEFNDAKAQREMSGALREYFDNNRDIEELRLRLSEAPPLHYVYFLLQMLDMFVESNNASQRQALVQLMGDEVLVQAFTALSAEVEMALMGYYPLKVLVETTLDSKEAPERIGEMVSLLMQNNIVSLGRVGAMVEEFKALTLEEGCFDAEEIDRVFGRFLTRVESA